MQEMHRRCQFNPWVGEILWSRKWQPTPVFFLTWRIPWTEEPGGLQSIGSQRVGRYCMKQLSTHGCKKIFFLGWGLLRLSLYFRSYSLYLIKLAFCLFCFLDFMYKWYRMVIVFFYMTNFMWHNALSVCPCCCRWQAFILFNGWFMWACVHAHTYLYHPLMDT